MSCLPPPKQKHKFFLFCLSEKYIEARITTMCMNDYRALHSSIRTCNLHAFFYFQLLLFYVVVRMHMLAIAHDPTSGSQNKHPSFLYFRFAKNWHGTDRAGSSFVQTRLPLGWPTSTEAPAATSAFAFLLRHGAGLLSLGSTTYTEASAATFAFAFLLTGIFRHGAV